MASMIPLRWFSKPAHLDVSLETIKRLYEPLQVAIICFDTRHQYLWRNSYFDTSFNTAKREYPNWLIEPLQSILDYEETATEIEHPIKPGNRITIQRHHVDQYNMLSLIESQAEPSYNELRRLLEIFSNRLADRVLKPVSRHLANMVEQNSNQTADANLDRIKNQRLYMTEGLQWLSLINAKINIEMVSWRKLTQLVEETFSNELSRIGGSIINNCRHSALIDAKLASMLLHELVDNAIKFRRTSVPLKIDVTTDVTTMGHCQLTIQDNGTGIHSAISEKEMLPFERGSDVSTAGVGIGLAKCALIAIRHNARISARPTVEQGTRIEITWRTKAGH